MSRSRPICGPARTSAGVRSWGQVRGSSGGLRAVRGRGAAGTESTGVAGKTCKQALLLCLPPAARPRIARRSATRRRCRAGRGVRRARPRRPRSDSGGRGHLSDSRLRRDQHRVADPGGVVCPKVARHLAGCPSKSPRARRPGWREVISRGRLPSPAQLVRRVVCHWWLSACHLPFHSLPADRSQDTATFCV
jgi:hypothetical protein